MVFASAVDWITVDIGTCVGCPLFGVPLGAHAILHARTGRVQETTRAMDHVPLHKLIHVRVGGRIWQFS